MKLSTQSHASIYVCIPHFSIEILRYIKMLEKIFGFSISRFSIFPSTKRKVPYSDRLFCEDLFCSMSKSSLQNVSNEMRAVKMKLTSSKHARFHFFNLRVFDGITTIKHLLKSPLLLDKFLRNRGWARKSS